MANEKDQPQVSDDDAISITSTVPSVLREQYGIRCILAEEEQDGRALYLVAWEDYPEDRYTWEPRENFDTEETFRDWGERQMRVTRGLEEPFDVEAWRQRVSDVREEKEARKTRRREKRLRLGLQDFETPSDSSYINSSDDDQPTPSEKSIPENVIANRRVLDSSSSDEEVKVKIDNRRIFKGEEKASSESRPPPLETSKISQSAKEPLEKRQISMTTKPGLNYTELFVRQGSPSESSKIGQKEKYTGTARNEKPRPTVKPLVETSQGAKTRPPPIQQKPENVSNRQQNVASVPNTSASTRPRAVQLGAKGSGPSRVMLSGQHKSRDLIARVVPVGIRMESGAKTKSTDKRKTSMDGGLGKGATKFFKNLSTKNRYLKRSRNEPEPNIDKLTFINPKTGKAPKDLVAPAISPRDIAQGEAKKRPFQQFLDNLATVEEDPVQPARGAEGEPVKATSSAGASPRRQPVSSTISGQPAKVNTALQIQHQPPPKHTAVEPAPQVGISDVAGFRGISRDTIDDFQGPLSEGGVAAYEFSPLHISRSETGSLSAESPRSMHPPYQTSNHMRMNPPRHSFLYQQDTKDVKLAEAPTADQKAGLFHMKVDNYVVGTLFRDPECKKVGRVKLGGLQQHHKHTIIRNTSVDKVTSFHLTKICTAMEYEELFHDREPGREIIDSGFVVPYVETRRPYEKMIHTLTMHLSCGMLFTKDFTILFWPAGSNIWGFLEKYLSPVPEGTELRFVVRTPLPRELEQPGSWILDKYAKSYPEIYQQAVEHVKSNPMRPGEKAINVVMRDLYNIDYNRLVTNNSTQELEKCDTFFLCFVPVSQELWDKSEESCQRNRARLSSEHDLFVEFLRANGAKGVYSMQNIGSVEVERKTGAWDYFRRNVTRGCIVFHDEFIRHDLLPGLGKFLLNTNINAFKFSMKRTSTSSKWSHLVRLFPHGCCFLLTESLFLRRPHEALRILRWFRLVQRPVKPLGTWKVAMRMHPLEWILKMMDEFEKHQAAFPGIYQLYADIFTEIAIMLYCRPEGKQLVMVKKDTFDVPLPKAAIMCPISLKAFDQSVGWKGDVRTNTDVDLKDIEKNDDVLVEWFAQTSTMHFEEFRRFIIVVGYEKENKKGSEHASRWKNKYGYVDVYHPEGFYAFHKVPSASVLAEMETTRQQRLCEDRPRVHAELLEAKRETRECKAALVRINLSEYRKQTWMERETSVVSATRDFMRNIDCTEEEIRRLQILDDEGRAVEPPATGEYAWTRKLDGMGFPIEGGQERRREGESRGGSGAGSADVVMGGV